jgi:hypothetical protein
MRLGGADMVQPAPKWKPQTQDKCEEIAISSRVWGGHFENENLFETTQKIPPS